MSTTRPVVVGIDGSIASQAAVVRAAWEAERRGLRLLMVSGYLVPPPCLTPLAPLLDETVLLGSARARLAQLAQTVRSRRPQLPITTRAVRAGGGAALIQASETASLIVVGAPHRRGFAGLSLGSVAGLVTAQASCPVLVLRRSGPALGADPAQEDGPVLVGVDGPGSENVLRFGFEEAAARRVPLIAAHVWSVPEFTGLNGVGTGWDADPVRAQEQLQENAERTLAEVMAGWQERYPQVPVRRWVIHSFETAQTLLQVSRAVSADLIVVGSRGRGPVTGAVLGSVSQVLIGQAVAPVAVIGPLAGPRVEAVSAGGRRPADPTP